MQWQSFFHKYKVANDVTRIYDIFYTKTFMIVVNIIFCII
jgi:hypothetical protein